MKILVSGASGLVGRALVGALGEAGHSVRTLTRGEPRDIQWDPLSGSVDSAALERFAPNIVIHLAGENIASQRWSPQQKERIRSSRVEATEKLCTTLAAHNPRPTTFISASAIGFYGNRGDEILTEESPPGDGFLAQVCIDWEGSSTPLKKAGARVVHLRFGMILAREGGALGRMCPIFKKGLGGRLGSGDQWVSWITLPDVIRIISFTIEKEISGPINVVTPNPVTNREFTRALGATVHRPAILPAPAFALRAAFGEMADALLLSSQHVVPRALQREGFEFAHASLTSALLEVLS